MSRGWNAPERNVSAVTFMALRKRSLTRAICSSPRSALAPAATSAQSMSWGFGVVTSGECTTRLRRSLGHTSVAEMTPDEVGGAGSGPRMLHVDGQPLHLKLRSNSLVIMQRRSTRREGR